MNKKILNNILKEKQLFVPAIFTKKQIETIEMYLSAKKLSNSQKYSLYTSIKRKLTAIETLCNKESQRIYIYGEQKIVSGRVEKAQQLIEKFSAYNKVFVAGSYLFSKHHNDIDIFVIQERGHSEAHEGLFHIVKIAEKKLQDPVFHSAAKIAVSNFPIRKGLVLKPLKIRDLMSAYHEAVIEMMDNQARELTRFIVFNFFLRVKDTLLDGKELKEITGSLKLEQLEQITKELMVRLFSRTYLYVTLHDYVKEVEKAIETEKSIEHLKRYKSFYEELIHGSRSGKAETA